jgi:cobaltochelatase CobS
MTTSTTKTAPPPTPLNLDDMVAEALAQELGKKQENLSAKLASSVIPDKEKKKERKPLVLKTGYKSAYDILGIDDHAIADFAVRVFDHAEVPEQLVSMVPNVDPHYNADVTAALTILSAWEANERIMVYGLPGTGKSSLTRHLCALTNRPFIRVNFSEDIESSALLGGLVVEGGATVYKLGSLAEAVKYGAVFLGDEWDTASPGVVMAAQWLLEDGGKLFLRDMPGSNEDRTLTPHENFRFVATGNTNGQGDDTGNFGGTTPQNSATLDRFTTSFKMDYLPQAQEIEMIASRTGINKATAGRMVKVAQLVRNAVAAGQLSITMSPRTLISWAAKYERFGDKAIDVAYINKLRSADAKVVRDFVNKAFGYK